MEGLASVALALLLAIGAWTSAPSAHAAVGPISQMDAAAAPRPPSPASALTVQAAASPATTDVNLSIDLWCNASGGSGAYTSYTWALGDGGLASGAVVSYAYAAAGSPVATCTVTDSNGTQARGSVALHIDTAPSVTAGVNRTATVPGGAISFTASGHGGAAPYRFNWSFGDGTYADAANVSHAYPGVGQFFADVTLVDANGGTDVRPITIDVAFLQVFAGASVTDTTVGSTVAFTARAAGGSGGPFTMTWHFGDGTMGNGTVVDHVYSRAGTYTATVTLWDSAGDQETVRLPAITVLAASPPPGPGLWFYAELGLFLAAVAALVAAVMWRRRNRGPPVEGERSAATRRGA